MDEKILEKETVSEHIFKKLYIKSQHLILLDDSYVYNDLLLNRLNFDDRMKNLLDINNIFLISTLLEYNFSKLESIKNMGSSSIAKIVEEIKLRIALVEESEIGNKEILKFEVPESTALDSTMVNSVGYEVYEEIYSPKDYYLDVNGDVLFTDVPLTLLNFTERTSKGLSRNDIYSLQQLLRLNFKDLK
ncbi:MAG: hypothetical protein ACK5LT_09155, partial [Lachnospirales bacterium]